MFAACLLALVPFVAAFASGHWAKVLAVAVGLAAIAGIRSESLDSAPPRWSGLIGNEVVMTGRIASEPDPGRVTTGYEIEVEAVGSPVEMPGGGRVVIFVPQFAERMPLHAAVEVRGDLRLPASFEDFDYREYLRRQGVYGAMFVPSVTVVSPPGKWDMQSRLSDQRLRLEDGLRRALPEPQGTLAAGIAFGRDQGISSDTKKDFATSGMAHLVAVSGSNVVLVSALALVIAAPYIGRSRATMIAFALVLLYVPTAGLSWSVARSGIMALVLLVGWFAGRPQSGLAGLAFAVMVLTFIAPGAALDPGFQLSAAATGGLLTFGPWLVRGISNGARFARIDAIVGWKMSAIMGLSLAASISTAPVLLFHFGRMPVAAILTNLLVDPMFPVVFVFSWLVALLSLVSDLAAWVAGLGAYYPLALLTWLAETTSTWPSISLDDGNFWLATVSMLTAMAVAFPAYLRQPRPRQVPVPPPRLPSRYAYGAAGSIIAVAVFSLGLAPLARPGTLRIDFLDVGQGDATLITTPGGTRLLVDGGPSGYELLRELGAVMPHWDRQIDVVILTHADQDHVAGLANLQERYSVGTWFDNGGSVPTPAFAAFIRGVPERSTLAAGQVWELDGMSMEVLWPPPGATLEESNDSSVVLRITHGEVSFLLTGDIEAEVMRTLAADPRYPSAVLKVPHHGSRTSDPGALAEVNARLAVVSAGCDNTFGHPAAPTLDALGTSSVLRTDVNGRITVISDGTSLDVHMERAGSAAEQTPGGASCRR